jgi:hypothetical protein
MHRLGDTFLLDTLNSELEEETRQFYCKGPGSLLLSTRV